MINITNIQLTDELNTSSSIIPYIFSRLQLQNYSKSQI